MWTHGVGMGTVHPIIKERLVRLAHRLSLVAASEDIDRFRRIELVRKVAVHFRVVGALVAHDQDLTTTPVHSMALHAYTHKRL